MRKEQWGRGRAGGLGRNRCLPLAVSPALSIVSYPSKSRRAGFPLRRLDVGEYLRPFEHVPGEIRCADRIAPGTSLGLKGTESDATSVGTPCKLITGSRLSREHSDLASIRTRDGNSLGFRKGEGDPLSIGRPLGTPSDEFAEVQFLDRTDGELARSGLGETRSAQQQSRAGNCSKGQTRHAPKMKSDQRNFNVEARKASSSAALLTLPSLHSSDLRRSADLSARFSPAAAAG